MGVKRIYNTDADSLANIQKFDCCDNSEGVSPKLFKYQSPIDLRGATDIKQDETLALNFEYQKQMFEQTVFANAFHLVPQEKISFLRFEEEHYVLIDIHIHFPSEHILEETNSEFEIHFVHENQNGQKIVVGVLYNTANDEFIVKNELRRHILMEEFLGTDLIYFNPQKYIPTASKFYHLVGSLTTPPYSGPVLWFIMETIPVANKKIIDRIKKHVPTANNRHIYPLANRQIWHN